MKPRIFKFRGLWLCKMDLRSKTGVGYTPKQAYDDWMSREIDE